MSGLSIDQQAKLTRAGAVVLQNLLLQHGNITEKIIQLDDYVWRLTSKAIECMKNGDKGRALQLLQRRCVVDGLKYVYRQYRLRKWVQVQKLVSSIVHALHPHATPPQPLPLHTDSTQEEEQVQKYAQTMMVAQCNFSRFD